MNAVHSPKTAFDIYDRVKRILEGREKQLGDIDKALRLHKKLEKRILQEEARAYIDDLERSEEHKRMDFKSFDSQDFSYDEQMANQLIDVQNTLGSSDESQVELLKKQYYIKNFETSIDDVNDPDIFKTITNSRVDLAAFQSSFGFVGIDIKKVVRRMNWNLNEDQILQSIVFGQSSTEVIDPRLVGDLNDIGNDDVKLFYRDAYLNFKREELKSLNETVYSILSLYGRKDIELNLREEYAIYDYLVRKFGQKDAAEAWQMLNDKLKEIEEKIRKDKEEKFAKELGQSELTEDQKKQLIELRESFKKQFIPIPNLIELASKVKKSSEKGFIENDQPSEAKKATQARKRKVLRE